MTTPTKAPPAPPPNITTGDIKESVFIVGDNNQVQYNAAGAIVNNVTAEVKVTPVGPPIAVLPSEADPLVGRQAENEALETAIQASKKVSFYAANGMGKTALVSKLIYSLNEADPSRNIAYVNANGHHGDDLARDVYDLFFDRQNYIPNRQQIARQLQQAQALLFVDNLDVPGNDIPALINVAPRCSFVLISTECALPTQGEEVALSGLADADSVQLFQDKFGGSLDNAGKQAATQICKLLKGNPDLIIRTARAGRKKQKTVDEVLSDLETLIPSDPALATFATSDLKQLERDVLSFLAAAGDNPVTLVQLKLAFPEVDLDGVLDHLKDLHIIQSHSPRYSLCGRLSPDLAATWDLLPWHDRLLQTSINWLSEQRASQPVKDSLSMLEHVLSNAAGREKWSDVIRLGRLLEPFVFYYTRWQSWADVLNILLRAAKATANRALEGWALHQLGSRALAIGALDLAATNLNQALKIREALQDREGLDVTRHNLEVLKAASTPTRGNGSGKSGPTGARPLTYGFFGLTGLVVIAAAAYFLTHRSNTPPVPPIVPPPLISTTAAPIQATPTPVLTEMPTFTPTPTSLPTDTLTPLPTETSTPQGPFLAIVTVPGKFLACRYGPGAPYLQRDGLLNGSEVKVLGRADTAFGPWVYVNYVRPLTKGNGVSCWVNPKYLKMDGDISTLEPYYPDKAKLIMYYHPGASFPAPTDVVADRSGNFVNIMWTGYVLYPGDRESDSSPRFLVEAWTCINGKFLLYPIGVDTDAHLGAEGTFITESAQVEDDGGCGQQPYGNVYLAQRDGYVGPAPVIPWP